MRQYRYLAVILLSLLSLISCSRDPNVVKQRNLERGNAYFDKGNYHSAIIMYKRALEKDLKFGPAYYKMGLAELKQGAISSAVQAFRRAIDTLKDTTPEYWDSMIKITDIYLGFAHDNASMMKDVEANIAKILKHDPNSFDGIRMQADLYLNHAMAAYQVGHKDEAKDLLEKTIAGYRLADSKKPGDVGVQIQLARTLQVSGQFDEAEKLYAAVMAKNPSNVLTYKELFKLQWAEGKKDAAEATLKLGFKNNPKNFAFLIDLANFYYATNRRDDMINVLGQIKSHAKDYPLAYQAVGDFYARLGEGELAIKEYQDGIYKDPAKKQTYRKAIIQVLMNQGKPGEAAAYNAQILKDDPNDSDGRNMEATFLLSKGDVNRALLEFESVVTHSPDNPVARFNLGRANEAKGNWEIARQSYQKAIELQPNYMAARLALAHLQLAHGDYDAALKATDDILLLDKGNMTARLIQSAALLGQHKYGDSRARLNAMLQTNPNSPDVVFQKAVVDLAENKYNDAAEGFRRAYQLNPQNPRGLLGVVETKMAQGKPDEALKTLEAEADKNPSRLEIQVALGNTEVRAGHYDRALDYFNHVLSALDKTDKRRADVYLRLGETYRRKGDMASAVSALQDARKVAPDNIAVLSTLALVLDGAGRWPEAKQVYDAVLKLEPSGGVVMNNLAFLMAEHGVPGELDSALSLAQKAKVLMPNVNEVSDTLGWIYLKKGLNEQAIEIFQQLVQAVPDQSTYWFHLAMAHKNKGDKAHAKECLEKALKLNPPPYEKQEIQDLLTKVQ
jgi:tetratricopeptide (TPR) repeat protein